jgi:hypothetical protein
MEYPAPRTHMENEFVERRGVIHVSRILPDDLINRAKDEDISGAEPQLQSLHDRDSSVRLRCERLGNIDSLHFAEVSATELPLKDDCVEVEIFAAGLNFKVFVFRLSKVEYFTKNFAGHGSDYGYRARK